MNINDSVLVKSFLQRKTTAKSTSMTYTYALRKYFKTIEVKNIDEYFEIGRNYTDDVWKFAMSLDNLAPKTQKVMITAVKGFLERNDVEIKSREWEDILSRNNLRKPRPQYQKRTPTNSNLKIILSYGDIKSRALFLFVSSSGLRIGEALEITFSDIDMDKNHIRVKANLTKARVPRDTFFSDEAKDALERWFPERKRFLGKYYKKSVFVRDKLERDGYQFSKKHDMWQILKDGTEVPKEKLIEMEPRLFPFEYHNAVKMWINMLEKAGHPFNQKDGQYYIYNIHSLRRFWFTQLESSGANRNHLDHMGAHESELNATYTHFEFDKLKQTYDNHMNALAVFTEMDKIHREFKPKIQEQDTAIASIVRDNQRLKDELEELKKFAFYSIGSPPATKNQKELYKILKKIRPELPDED